MRFGKLADITDATVILVLVGGLVMWSGFVLSVLWAWFVVPAFGAHEISIPMAIGLMLLIRVVVGDSKATEKAREFACLNFYEALEILTVDAAKCGSVLYTAWLIKALM